MVEFVNRRWLATPRVSTPPLRPVFSKASGELRVAVWSNETYGGGCRVAVTLERRYRAPDGTWKSTSRLGASDLDDAAMLIEEARRAIEEM